MVSPAAAPICWLPDELGGATMPALANTVESGGVSWMRVTGTRLAAAKSHSRAGSQVLRALLADPTIGGVCKTE